MSRSEAEVAAINSARHGQLPLFLPCQKEHSQLRGVEATAESSVEVLTHYAMTSAEEHADMLPCMQPPLIPFRQGQRGQLAWLEAVLEINGFTNEPLKHDILRGTLQADRQYFSAASSASPRPYNALHVAALSYCGEPH
ncbi:hypothetical protein HPB50_001378 [Hyalomma asiaticum]|uniref:Uncharacterized protein n=1 Tax=Hyalomma asiaticum TaxID=266040 RepID=A0ACB7T5B2_HYAAI|nr:hypothetical protein HPB50_001378 [Hyalomma asiaticum]